ncbi:MAG: glycosyltransferase family 2 protein [Candidatus Sumerlaeia bacterium]|nr:glycosyltransferase family 2 protein [Candidatus Sumerlaeia bacterium]
MTLFFNYIVEAPSPLLSVVIPAYNRLDTLSCTLAVLRRALDRWGGAAEIVIVDDGSADPLEPRLEGFDDLPIRWIRQENQGSAVAKHVGIMAARGMYIQVLDSDDLVDPDKFAIQVPALETTGDDLVYSDQGIAPLTADWQGEVAPKDRWQCREVTDSVELFFQVQPGPHNPLYRASYLQGHLGNPLIPPHPYFGPAGDIWIYYNLVLHPVRFHKTPGHLAIWGESKTERVTNHWERLGFSSTLLMESFVARCPATPETERARTALAEVAFQGWRTLPSGMPALYTERRLTVFHKLPRPPLERLGGKWFRRIAAVLGPVHAANLLRKSQRPDYDSIRTIEREELDNLLRRQAP